MQNVKQLIVWAKAQSKQLKTEGERSGSNIYYARYEWIEFELLPKLEEILHTSSNTQSMPCRFVITCKFPHPKMCCDEQICYRS